MLGITGTDGKTTTTLMTKAILASAGRNPEAVGNTETPLIAALDSSADCFAVECSSFRLAFTERFRCKAAAWLNIAPDHLDWHANYDSYFAAKAKMWAHVAAGDIAVAPVDDAAILEVAQRSNARVVTFGAARGDYHAINGVLTSPHGVIMEERAMRRALPHDVTNALAAAALCIESGLASPAHVSEALASFEHAAHRIEFVRDLDGVRWYNDSKATSPHAAAVAIQSFDSIVLIAGGKNKDLDLNEMAAHRDHVRAVVATGASADAIEAAFSRHCVVRKASTMQEAIDHARELARSGDVVLLSPGCTSYDWYSNYAERGDDFRSRVLALR
jgi:UDP-N-acetylmuramoylalanine--D-glutamate ligase